MLNREMEAIVKINRTLRSTIKLEIKYSLLLFLLVIYTLIFGTLGLFFPEIFIEALISPSIQKIESLILNTRIRGFIAILLGVFAMAIHKNKLLVRIVELAIAWSTIWCLRDLSNIFYLEIYTSTITTTLFTLWRPTLIALLIYLRNGLKKYHSALELELI